MDTKILFVVAVIINMNYVDFIKGQNNDIKETNWILYKDDLYFIEYTKNFTSHEAQNVCIKNDMVYIIEKSELLGLFNKYERVLWLLNEDYLIQTPINRNYKDCFAWIDGGIYPESCANLHGVICKTKIDGASLQFKNGTFLQVGVEETNQFCDPKLDQYDEELEYCLIEMRKLLL